jgi:hypothetical protein
MGGWESGMDTTIDWLKSLDARLASAIVAAVVALLTSIITTLVTPGLKYRYDKRLESSKAEIQYRSEQQKALRNHIGPS